jgi:hypothetical protein
MFDLFPFPGTIIYSPVTRPSQLASGSSAQDDSLELSASSLDNLKDLKISRVLDSVDENCAEPIISSPALENAHFFLGSNGSEPTLTHTRNSPEQQEILSHKLRKRRGHKKSRNGCYNCKKRKIKAGHESSFSVTRSGLRLSIAVSREPTCLSQLHQGKT